MPGKQWIANWLVSGCRESEGSEQCGRDGGLSEEVVEEESRQIGWVGPESRDIGKEGCGRSIEEGVKDGEEESRGQNTLGPKVCTHADFLYLIHRAITSDGAFAEEPQHFISARLYTL